MNELQPQEYKNACLDNGLLVSLRDGELTPSQTEQALSHLAICPDCSADEQALRVESREMYDALASLGPSAVELPDTDSALGVVLARISVEGHSQSSRQTGAAQGGGTARRFRAGPVRFRKHWWIAAAAAILVALVLLPNAQALANQFLGLFQPQTFQPVSVNLDNFRDGVGEDLQNFGAISLNAGNLSAITHPTRTQIQQDLSFQLLLPSQLPPGVGPAIQYTLVNSSEGTFTFDAARARAYLAQTGQGNVAVPANLDGATFTVSLATGVIINYGKQCQAQTQIVGSVGSSSIPGGILHSQSAAAGTPAPTSPSQNGNGINPGSTASLGCSGGQPFYIAEIPSPVIRATGKASLEDLRNFILSLPKLTSSARELLQDVDLTSGVVPLPIPAQVQAEQVTTHGVRGVLLADSSLSVGGVLWQTGGIVYVIASATSDRSQLLNSANSLQ